MFNRAFTLAEVLISLVVIGVIAVLTIPALMNSYKTKVYGSQLKKVYSQLTLASKEVINDEHADAPLVDENGEEDYNKKGFYYTSAGTAEGLKDFLDNYLKNSKTDCGTGKSASCIASSYKSKDGENIGSISEDYYCVQTINGASVCIKFDEGYLWATTNDQWQTGVTMLLVDVNGIKKPNKACVDLFAMKILDDGTIEDVENSEVVDDEIAQSAEGCFYQIMTNGWK